MEILGGGLAVAVPLVQQKWAHEEWVAQEHDFHQSRIKLDIELARRDIVQEIRERQYDRTKILLMMDILLLACCFSMIREGQPAYKTAPYLNMLYTAGLSTSIGMILMSVFFVLRAQTVLSQYRILAPDHRYSCGLVHRTFVSFYICHAYRYSRASVVIFYIGAASLMFTASVTYYSRLIVKYKYPLGASTFGAVCLIFLIVVVILEWKTDVGSMVDENYTEFLDQQLSITSEDIAEDQKSYKKLNTNIISSIKDGRQKQRTE